MASAGRLPIPNSRGPVGSSCQEMARSPGHILIGFIGLGVGTSKRDGCGSVRDNQGGASRPAVRYRSQESCNWAFDDAFMLCYAELRKPPGLEPRGSPDDSLAVDPLSALNGACG